MKYYVFDNSNNNASWTIEEHLLSEDEKANAVIIDKLPTKDKIEGKYAILKCDKSKEKVWYEYEDIPISEEEKELNVLGQELANLKIQLMMGSVI